MCKELYKHGVACHGYRLSWNVSYRRFGFKNKGLQFGFHQLDSFSRYWLEWNKYADRSKEMVWREACVKKKKLVGLNVVGKGSTGKGNRELRKWREFILICLMVTPRGSSQDQYPLMPDTMWMHSKWESLSQRAWSLSRQDWQKVWGRKCEPYTERNK